MYVLVLIGLLGAGTWLLRRGIRRGDRSRSAAGAVVCVATLGFFALLTFWAEMLWFEALGYAPRFWTMAAARFGAVALGVAIGWGGAWLLTRPVARAHGTGIWPACTGGALGAIWGLEVLDELLLWLARVPTGLVEPILDRDTGFYLFTLPFLDRLWWLLLGVAAISLAASVVSLVEPREGAIRLEPAPDGRRTLPLLGCAAAFGAVLAWGYVLETYHLLYSEWGVVAGAGWTDVHVRLPALRITALATLVLGAVPLLPAYGRRVARWLGEPPSEAVPAIVGLRALRRRVRAALRASAVGRTPDLLGLGLAWSGIAVIAAASLFAVPSLVQWLVVVPNEITFEKPYIAHNIRFTRHGFRLHEVEERRFPASEVFTADMVRENRHLLSEVRLWDWRALDAVYEQFQEIRLYYEFHDVDMDRYQIGDRYRQVMVSARELVSSNLPPQSQTFVNQRFKYTHGYGLTLTTVSDFTPDGLPHLLVKDIPPRSEVPELRVDQPQIYSGELTHDAAVVNTREREFDHPSGDENVYIHYPGSGGVHLKNLWRKLVFGWRLDGTRFLFSTYPVPETRVMFRRQIRERVGALAPFLELDDDPYVVLIDGRLHWIVDAYTTSRYYPYSEPYASREVIEYDEGTRLRRLVTKVVESLDGANYVRNSVKAVVDAFDGSVRLYVFDPDDPIVRVWRRVFPGLFRDRGEMPAGLRAHVRYPNGLLLAQGLVYAKYHMGDPAVFYNQEDLWVRATEKYYAHLRPVDPYYVMWQLPGSDRAEFVLMQPFTPKNRHVLIGWIAGLCDGENYGRFLAYKFSKEKRVLGPQHVETKIDQDRFLAGQLTLWDQRGSNVIRGNVLAIPIGDTLLYVEPIYLQAETAAYPELRLVVVMHGDDLSYAETFGQALRGLFDAAPPSVEAPAEEASLQELAQRANAAFERYLELQAEQRFDEAARELEAMRDALRRLAAP
jgi:uncharacterized membrane protein (UPF0182 family)